MLRSATSPLYGAGAAVCCASVLRRAQKECTKELTTSAAGSGVRSAPRWSLHPSFTHLLCEARSGCQRLRDGHCPAGLALWLSCWPSVQCETLPVAYRSEEHTSELQSQSKLVC